ncbi:MULTISPECIES: DMT family transporter [Methylotenera]|uniref:DMT family transporter n=1 Tax=Methylotenera TaxID=359407 RepID=UPI000363C046|nr:MULTISPECIES: DMT family transporter [Methylotenera]
MGNSKQNYLAIFGLLFGAMCWGIIWYPYRIMSDAGVSGVTSSFYTYCIAIILGIALFARHWRGVFKLPKSAIWLSIVAGWTNLSYVLAVIDGEVMRVMLLFYLAPLWTLLLAHFWLKETITKAGLASILIAMIGAYIMLANPFDPATNHIPMPQNSAEWLALSAGIGFSFTNVIARKSAHLSLAAKSMLIWVGVAGVSLLFIPFLTDTFPSPQFFTLNNWLIMGIIAILIMAATIFVQYGVTKMPALRASVLFLFELVVAAIAAYYLANEAMLLNEWIGGAFIIAAGLLAAFNHADN